MAVLHPKPNAWQLQFKRPELNRGLQLQQWSPIIIILCNNGHCLVFRVPIMVTNHHAIATMVTVNNGLNNGHQSSLTLHCNCNNSYSQIVLHLHQWAPNSCQQE
jgi:hypothetical protein